VVDVKTFEESLKEMIEVHQAGDTDHVVEIKEDPGYLPYVKLVCHLCGEETYHRKDYSCVDCGDPTSYAVNRCKTCEDEGFTAREF